MNTFIFILKIVSGPVLGGLIGLLTNYIAIKMLFRPYKPKFIAGRRLPFTPGMIPKRQPELAKAIGDTISGSLLTPEDIKKYFVSQSAKEQIASAISSFVFGKDFRLNDISDSAKALDAAAQFLTSKLMDAAKNMDLGGLFAQKANEAVRESSFGMIAALIPPKTIAGILQPIGGRINEYIEDEGYEAALPAVRSELEKLAERPVSESAGSLGLDKERLEHGVIKVYEEVFAEKLAGFVAGMDVSGIVEEKIKQMDLKELEKLVLKVSGKELKAIVLLGGLLGFVIGIATSLLMII